MWVLINIELPFTFLCFGISIALKFNILRNDYVCVTSVDVGSMLDIDLVLLVAGPVFMARCLAAWEVYTFICILSTNVPTGTHTLGRAVEPDPELLCSPWWSFPPPELCPRRPPPQEERSLPC